MTVSSEPLIDGLAFPEGVRWHAGAVWFSDMHGEAVIRLEPGVAAATVATVPGSPSGLGFLPDGTPLVVSMHDRRVLRVEAGGTREHADLSDLATWHCNDMCVDARGRAYVSSFGDSSVPPDPPLPTVLIMVEPDGSARAVAEDLWFPNGVAITDGGGTLVVAETRSVPGRLTAFTIADDGTLSDRRTLASFEGGLPDGIAADAGGGVWVALPFGDELAHVSAGGEIDEVLAFPSPYSVALGGEGGRELFVCTAPSWEHDEAVKLRQGAVHRLEYEAPSPSP
jgi:sugar lactone lactonase YvrE